MSPAAILQQPPRYSLEVLPVALPTANVSDDADIRGVAEQAFKDLGLPSLNMNFLTKNAVWRDSWALTGTLRTFYTATTISKAWRDVVEIRKPANFSLLPETVMIRRSGKQYTWVECMFQFETTTAPETSCLGFISFTETTKGKWKVWLVRTVMEQLIGLPDIDAFEPSPVQPELNGTPVPSTNSAKVLATSGLNGNEKDTTYLDCVVVGGGQAGLSVAGRCKALGVSYTVLEKNRLIGDNWLDRYDSAKLHTSRSFAHLPFDQTFPPLYPELLSKYDLAQGYQDWVKKYAIRVWLSTSLESGSWNEDTKIWTLHINRHGTIQTLQCRHLVLATGRQEPFMPQYLDPESFKGTVMHSIQYKSATSWKGKRGVIIGTANTAHDVVEDMLEAGLSSVTMVQRSRTEVLPYEYVEKLFGTLYNDHLATRVADRIGYSMPNAVSRLDLSNVFHAMADAQPGRFDALEKAGFKVERHIDLTYALSVRAGGHYVDVGNCENICAGLVNIKSDALPVSYTEDGLLFSDGSRLDADVIVFCTGFRGKIRDSVEEILGHDVAAKSQEFWGLDDEGELRGAFKPSGHPGLWLTGGTQGHARYYSRFIAMQIKADLDGKPFQVYDGHYAEY